MDFDRNEFVDWYTKYEQRFLKPAADQIERALREMLDTKFQDRQRNRYRLSSPRIKSSNRAFQKLQRPKYVERVHQCADVPAVLDDLVGMRITCTNESDVDDLREALVDFFQEADFPKTAKEEPGVSYAIECDSFKNYIDKPKDSGYRAFHLSGLSI